MKTVAFIDPRETEIWATFKRYELLFERLQAVDTFCVCPWERSARSVAQAVPRLPELLDGVRESDDWQALVITDLRRGDEELSSDEHFDNPYDFPEYYRVMPSDPFEESDEPLIRLTQMLGGLPDRIYLTWVLPEDVKKEGIDTGKVTYVDSAEDYELMGRYRLGLPAPSRIICLTPRDYDEAFFERREREIRTMKDASVLVPSEGSGSDDGPVGSNVVLPFWERNGYPAITRFLVCDRRSLMHESENQEQDDQENQPDLIRLANEAWLQFWLGVRKLASNPPLPWELRAYDLYSMRVVVDEDEIARCIRSNFGEWERARVSVGREIEQEKHLLVASELDTHVLPTYETSIQVRFDHVESDGLTVSPEPLGLFKDRPDNDLMIWRHQKERSDAEYRNLLKAPRVGVRLATLDFKEGRKLSEEELEYCVLNEREKDNLKDRLRQLELELAGEVGNRPFDDAAQLRSTREVSEQVEDAVDERPKLGQGLKTIGITAAGLFVGLVAIAAIGFITNSASLWIALAGSGIVAVACLGAAYVLKRKLQSLYDDYNDAVRENYESLESEARRLSRRFSAYATYRKGHSILERQERLDLPTQRQDSLERTNARLANCVEELVALAEASNIRLPEWDPDHGSERPWDELSRELGEETFYHFPLRSRDANVSFVESLEFDRLRII